MINRIGQIPLKAIFWVLLALPFVLAWLGNTQISFQNFQTTLDIPKADPKRKTLLEALLKISSLPLTEKRETLLFIPQSNYLYWDWYKNCKATPFIAPAITGIASLDGLPKANCAPAYYGYSAYQLRSPDQPTLQASDTTHICEAAQRRGFAKVIVLDVDQKQNFKLQSLDCSK